jgi:hypothetical protein
VRKLIPLLILVTLPGLFTSCAKKGGGKTCFPVKGQVLFKNQPVVGALVVFEPATKSDPHWPSATGITDDEGKFSLTTYEEDDGAPAGEYNVGISANGGGFKRKAPLKKKPDRSPSRPLWQSPNLQDSHPRRGEA